MRTLLAIFLFFSTIPCFSGGFLFPNVKYSYAKLYFYNIYWDEVERPDQDIYANGTYASSKIGNGIDLSDETLDQIKGVFARGANELVMGLSKCFIPRHGIIYYNSDNQPVASLSICFECEKIDFWSAQPVHMPKIDPSKFDIDYAEKQIAQLKEIFEANNILVSEHKETYQTVADSDESFKNQGSITFNRPDYDEKYYKRYTFEEVKKWQLKTTRYPLKEDVNIEISAGGDKYRFRQLVGKDDSYTLFEFSDDSDDAYLYDAHIADPAIQTPMGIQVGMSLEQLQTHIGLWDGISNPETVTIQGEKISVTYSIEKQTIVKIMILFDIT